MDLKKNVGTRGLFLHSYDGLGYCLIQFDYEFEVGVVPVGFELGVDSGFALVVIFLVNGALQVLEAVLAVAKTGVSHGTEVVDLGGLIKTAVEGTDAVLGLVVHELGKGKVVVAGRAFEEFLCFLVVAALEVQQRDVGLSIGAALALGFLKVVFGKGVVLLCQAEKTRVVEDIGVVGVEVASHFQEALSLAEVAKIESDGTGIVPSAPFGTMVLGSLEGLRVACFASSTSVRRASE